MGSGNHSFLGFAILSPIVTSLLKLMALNLIGFQLMAGYLRGKLGPVLFRVMINDLELRPTNNDHWKYVESYSLMIAVYISIFLFIEKWETWPSLFIYLFNFANYIHIHTRITYNGQMAGNTLQLTPITAAL